MEKLDNNDLILERIRSDFEKGVDPTELMSELERVFKIPKFYVSDFCEAHPMVIKLYTEINDSRKIWRYMDLMKFISLLNGQLFFARADLFKDPFEGAVPKKVLDSYVQWMSYPKDIYGSEEADTDVEIRKEYVKKFEKNNKKVAINCWQMNKRESTVMWESYIKSGLGVVVVSSVGKVTNIKIPEAYQFKHFPVEYIDYDEEYDQKYIRYELIPFMNKRKQFDSEKEYRFMLYKDKSAESLNGIFNQMVNQFGENLKQNNYRTTNIINQMFVSKVQDLTESGVNVQVNPSEIIEGIIAHPNMKDYEIAGLQKLLDKYNCEFGSSLTIGKSSLAENPY